MEALNDWLRGLRYPALFTILLLLTPTISGAEHPCTSPLVLDLNDEGRIRTVSVDSGVLFDIDADGVLEQIGWTYEGGEEAFLWLDLNHNGVVDDGGELFGDSTITPDGEHAANGFEALAIYDRLELGGNGDGRIDNGDLIWPHLRLWMDADRNGISVRSEISHLAQRGVLAIGLDYTEVDELDGALNLHALRGEFLRHDRRFGKSVWRVQRIDDVIFDWRP